MTVIEYGKQNKDVVVLLHGGGLSWWNYRDAAEILSEDFHVVLPVLDGHGDLSLNQPSQFARMVREWSECERCGQQK